MNTGAGHGCGYHSHCDAANTAAKYECRMPQDRRGRADRPREGATSAVQASGGASLGGRRLARSDRLQVVPPTVCRNRPLNQPRSHRQHGRTPCIYRRLYPSRRSSSRGILPARPHTAACTRARTHTFARISAWRAYLCVHTCTYASTRTHVHLYAHACTTRRPQVQFEAPQLAS